MTTLKKRLLIAAAALAIITCGAAIGNSASAAGTDDGRDYRIALRNADADKNTPPPAHMKKDRPAPPKEHKDEFKKEHKEDFKKPKKADKKWEKKHEDRHDKGDRGMRPGPRHGGPRHDGPDGRHMPPPPPEKR